MAVIFDVQKKCDSLLTQLKRELDAIPDTTLCLASVIVGQDDSAKSYRFSQAKLAKELRIEFRSFDYKSDFPLASFKSEIGKLNRNKSITGIILNKPFPAGWGDVEVFSLLNENKDIEGMHPNNLGRFFTGEPRFISPTVLSVIELIKESGVELYGARVTLVGFSPLIGRPLALWFGNQLATVNITHIATSQKGDLSSYIKGADILISAVGEPGLIKGEWIKRKAVVIDVGTGSKTGRITGDVEFNPAKERAGFITPVPGGVGKLTSIFLFKNLVAAYRLSLKN